MKLASIQIITDIRPIEGADRIEAATVLGYQTVIKKGEFRPGDLCVWHEPDTVAAEKPEYEFFLKQGFRLKVSRFKGQVSQGLALPLAVLPPGNHAVGEDATALTGIRKYEKPLFIVPINGLPHFFNSCLRLIVGNLEACTCAEKWRSNLALSRCSQPSSSGCSQSEVR